MACTTVAKQTYALPARPDLSGGLGSVSSAPQPAAPQGDIRPVSNDTLQSDDATGAPVKSGGFLGAPTTLASGVLESATPEATPPAATAQPTTDSTAAQPASEPAQLAAPATRNAPVTAPGSVQGSVAPAASAPASAAGNYVVQVGAVSDSARAAQWQQKLSQQFSVPGRVSQNGAVYRVQLGPFASKTQAASLQQRLQSEAQVQSFITVAQ